MRRPKAKFKAGDTVMETVMEYKFVIETVHFDPCDGWEYGPDSTGNKVHELFFEEDLELICN